MWGKLLAATVVSVACAVPAGATPADPYADDWVAIAVSPNTGAGGFGSSGTREDAVNIAMTSCALKNPHCMVADVTEYGCVAYVIDLPSNTWAGGRGPDDAAALNDAGLHMPPDKRDHLTGGSHCSIPLTPP